MLSSGVLNNPLLYQDPFISPQQQFIYSDVYQLKTPPNFWQTGSTPFDFKGLLLLLFGRECEEQTANSGNGFCLTC